MKTIKELLKDKNFSKISIPEPKIRKRFCPPTKRIDTKLLYNRQKMKLVDDY